MSVEGAHICESVYPVSISIMRHHHHDWVRLKWSQAGISC